MANVKSAKKRILVNEKKAARNKSAKSAVKTQVKKVLAAIDGGDKVKAEEQLSALQLALDTLNNTETMDIDVVLD